MAKATHLVFWTCTYGEHAEAAKREDGTWFERYQKKGPYRGMGKWEKSDDQGCKMFEAIITESGDGRIGFNKANWYNKEKIGEKIAVRLPNI